MLKLIDRYQSVGIEIHHSEDSLKILSIRVHRVYKVVATVGTDFLITHKRKEEEKRTLVSFHRNYMLKPCATYNVVRFNHLKRGLIKNFVVCIDNSELVS